MSIEPRMDELDRIWSKLSKYKIKKMNSESEGELNSKGNTVNMIDKSIRSPKTCVYRSNVKKFK